MEALIASYGGEASTSDSDTETTTSAPTKTNPTHKTQEESVVSLPPPPVSLLTPPHSIPSPDRQTRVRSFPHVQGNFALHVYIPVEVPIVSRKEIVNFGKKISSVVPGLHVVDVDIPINSLCKDDQRLEQVLLGREFHISLGRTVPIRVHQIDSVVSMLRQKLQLVKRYWIDFNKWEVFVNDDETRTFLSAEVVDGGLREITKQIQSVNEVYKLHNLPEFYKDPRPHISLAWALGNISDSLKRAVEEETKRSGVGSFVQKRMFTCQFSGIECKVGNKTYKICRSSEQ